MFNFLLKDPEPTKVIRRERTTIILFDDGSKSVVKLRDGEKDDMYSAVCAALAKRLVGSHAAIKRLVESVEYQIPEQSPAFWLSPEPITFKLKLVSPSRVPGDPPPQPGEMFFEIYDDLFTEMNERSQ